MKNYHIRWYKDELQLEGFENKNEIVINDATEQGQQTQVFGSVRCLGNANVSLSPLSALSQLLLSPVSALNGSTYFVLL